MLNKTDKIGSIAGKNSSEMHLFGNESGQLHFNYLDGVFRTSANAYLSVLSICIIVGNVITMLVIWTSRVANKQTVYFLTSLAVSDFLIGMISVPSYILWLNSNIAHLDRTICISIISSALFLTIASILNLLMLSIERYLAVCYTLRHLQIRNSQYVMPTVIAAVWMLSFVLSIASMGTIRWDFRECSYNKLFNENFLVCAILMGVLLPLCLMIAIYIRIYKTTRNHLFMINESFSRSGSSRSLQHIKKHNKATFKIVITLVLVLASFTLSWGPFFVAIFLRSVCEECKLPEVANEIILFLGFTNSLTNPVIYTLRHKSFRRNMYTLFCRTSRSKEYKLKKGSISI